MKKPPERLCKKCNNLYLKNCEYFPIDIWKDLPDFCGYRGWIFLLREKEKQKVRRRKERILSVLAEMNEASIHRKKVLLKEIENLENFIKKYKQYGSENW